MLTFKQIKGYISTAMTTSMQRWSAANTTIITVIIITPLCGFLFQCGCDWPWSGLDSRCNFYSDAAHYKCPWCASLVAGVLSTALAISAGVSVATIKQLSGRREITEIGIRTLCGVGTFVMVAIISAGSAALWQDYPLGLGRYLP